MTPLTQQPDGRKESHMNKFRKVMISLGAVAAFLMAAGAGFKNF